MPSSGKIKRNPEKTRTKHTVSVMKKDIFFEQKVENKIRP